MIGYYAHQHGNGHLNFARLFTKVFGDQIRTYSSLEEPVNFSGSFLQLADENPDGSFYSENQIPPPDYLHYSPVGQQSIQRRSVQILQDVWKHQIKLMIVDVSVEIAALMRAASVPYAYVKLPGNRNDAAHMQAFQGAIFVLAYYPEGLESDETPQWLREKTIYLGFMTDRELSNTARKPSAAINNILVISGGGGNQKLVQAIKVLPERFPSAEIKVIGMPKERFEDQRIINCGYLRNFDNLLKETDLVVANCGLNAVTEILQSQVPYVAIPEDRPYQEQQATAKFLYKEQLAVSFDSLFTLNDSEILQHKIYPIDHKLSKLQLLKDHIVNNHERLPLIPSQIKTSTTHTYAR